MDPTTKFKKKGSLSVLEQDGQTTKLISSSKILLKNRLSNDPNQEKSYKDEQGKDSVTVWDLQRGKIPESDDIIRVYKRRWLVLTVFFVYAIVGNFQWSMYAIIANIITKYYNVSNLSVDFTTLSFLIPFILTFLPASWILNNLGLRWTMLIGCFLNALGCFLRVFSVPRDKFWFTIIGQLIVGLSQVPALIIPTRLAAVWFPAHQVSFACGFAFNGIMIPMAMPLVMYCTEKAFDFSLCPWWIILFGRGGRFVVDKQVDNHHELQAGRPPKRVTQVAISGEKVGNAIGFLAPPILVRNSENLDDIAEDLDRLYIGIAASAFSSLLLTIAFFQEKPPLPPSHAQRLQRDGAKRTESPKEFFRSLKRLLTKRTYVTLLISFAFIVGVFCAIVTLLNQVLIPHFPGQEREVGIAGLILIVSGIVSSAICGYILDRTHAFKLTTVALYLLTLAGWIAFAVLLRFGNMALIYLSTAILGFATTAVQPVCLEFGVEVTFPESEATASGLMCAAVQVCGILFTLLYGYMLESWGDDLANAAMAFPIVIGCCMSMFIRPRLKRQAAQPTGKATEDIHC